MTWNQGGILDGARHITIAGSVFYIVADRGIVVLDMNDPLQPRLLAVIPITDARATALQFRYLFVASATGLQVVDVTHPETAAHRRRCCRRACGMRVGSMSPAPSPMSRMAPMVWPSSMSNSRASPGFTTLFDAGGRIHDACDVVVASTNASLFAYVADGRDGLQVLQLTSPASQPNFYGFSPDPKPELIAWRHTANPALAIAKGLDRDRAVDETGHQIAVFGRIGSRPFNLDEMRKLYLDNSGRLQTVSNVGDPSDFVPAPEAQQNAAYRTPVRRGGPVFRQPGQQTAAASLR